MTLFKAVPLLMRHFLLDGSLVERGVGLLPLSITTIPMIPNSNASKPKMTNASITASLLESFGLGGAVRLDSLSL
ncbi:MAG: hypothetical protein NPIRA04_14630 [Nitrospirales bacterium]|nr:MAG: hypothetical protein NPIRA04_14630 [Nitrospirales bacterium]